MATAYYDGYVGVIDTWSAGAVQSETLVEKVSKAVSGQATYLAIAAKIWKLDRMQASVIASMHDAIESPNLAKPKSGPPPTRESALATTAEMKRVYAGIESLFSMAKKQGLTNRTLTGGAFNSVMQRGEEIPDIAEVFELALKGNSSTIFKDAVEEYNRGETFGLDAIL